MATFIGPDNAIAWAQFQRKGGLKNALGTAGAYAGIIGAVILVTARLNPRHAQDVYSGWSTGLLALQSLFVVVIGAGRVSAMIRGDITTGIAESHRMMPMPPGHAVAGYLAAAAAAMSGFFVANLGLGVMTTMLADLPPGRWVAANLILLAFAVFVWTISAFAAFLAKGSGAVLAVSSMAGLFGNAGLLWVAPGVTVLLGPLIGGSIFNLRTAQTELSLPLILSLCAQLLVGSIFFAGAARKYRRPDGLALGGCLAWLLLLAFVGISVMAIVRWEEFQPGFMAWRTRGESSEVPFLGSAVLCMIVALAPLANFARQHVMWMRLREDDPGVRRVVPGPLVSGLVVAATLALVVFASPRRPTGAEWGCTLAGLAGFSLSAVFVAAWVYRVVDNAKVILGIWLAAYCVVPVVVDLVRHGMSDDYNDPTLAFASSFSPAGLLIEVWTHADVNLVPAVVAHLVVPLLPMGLYWREMRKGRTAEV
jgi:hypothetical protein